MKGASDAGFYVGQSRNIIVRRNRAEGNVAGIEIENSIGADVYENTATGNTGGILVFNLPDLPMKGGKQTGCTTTRWNRTTTRISRRKARWWRRWRRARA